MSYETSVVKQLRKVGGQVPLNQINGSLKRWKVWAKNSTYFISNLLTHFLTLFFHLTMLFFSAIFSFPDSFLSLSLFFFRLLLILVCRLITTNGSWKKKKNQWQTLPKKVWTFDAMANVFSIKLWILWFYQAVIQLFIAFDEHGEWISTISLPSIHSTLLTFAIIVEGLQWSVNQFWVSLRVRQSMTTGKQMWS